MWGQGSTPARKKIKYCINKYMFIENNHYK